LVKRDLIEHGNAIVLLMGSFADRVLEAVDLYQTGVANNLIIVEGQIDGYVELKARGADITSSARQVGNAAVLMGLPADKVIILPGAATSTQDEAMTIREHLSDKHEVDTLLLVSSSPHMRRASMIFMDAFRKSHKDICVICCPSSYTEFNAKKWWRDKDDIETVLIGYMQIANFLLFDKRKL
jgi:uncharacterized SAM-binding protein YcdF (DUF218 family)